MDENKMADEIRRLREALQSILDLEMGRGDGVVQDYIEDIHRIATDALAAPKEATDDDRWQPIETAPKEYDHRIIATDGEWVGEVSWQKQWYGDKTKPGWMIANCDEEYGHYIDAILWMPFPAPPSPAGEGR